MPTTEKQVGRLRFADWEVLPVEGKLFVRGVETPIKARAFGLLMKLVENPGQVISRETLFTSVWQGRVVEDGNLSVQISALRKLLGADTIRTIPGLGYCFSATAIEAMPPVAPAVMPPPAAPTRPHSGHGNLPLRLPELIGREKDLADLAALVQCHRVISIAGAGGIGKTQLALATAQRLRAGYPGGVWVVELAPLTDPGLIPAAVAQALGLRLPGMRSAQDEAIDALPDSALLVLDNCEHLVAAVCGFVKALLERGTAVTVLVTSQELLKLPDEQVYRLAPLSVPAEGSDLPVMAYGSVQLLAARVGALDHRFIIDDANAADAALVCRRLDGLPLAIELAAARIPLLGLAGVRERLDESLCLLTGGSRAGLPRHRTMRKTLEWSHGLLESHQSVSFRRLGVFTGSFGMEQAERVLEDLETSDATALDLLGVLVDKSLVLLDAQHDTVPRPWPRYRMLESAREYALELLDVAGETPQVRRRHTMALNERFIESQRRQWIDPSQLRLQEYLPDLDNVRTALNWAQHGDPALHGSLFGAAAWLFSASGHVAEARLHGRIALSRAKSTLSVTSRARMHQELAALLHDDSGPRKLRAARCAVALRRRQDDSAALYSALGRLAISAALCDDCPSAEAAVAEMGTLYRPDWPRMARWDLLNARDFVANLAGRLEEGMALAREQMDLAKSAGDTFKMMFAMVAREQCTATTGDYASAVEQGRELVELARRERYVEKLHVYLANLATSLMMDGQLDEALVIAREAAVLDTRNGSLWQSLDMLAMLAFRRGRVEEAARILGRAEAANAWRGTSFREPVESNVREALLSALGDQLAAARVAQLLDEGAALSDTDAAELALRP